jgi:hypothetical protein
MINIVKIHPLNITKTTVTYNGTQFTSIDNNSSFTLTNGNLVCNRGGDYNIALTKGQVHDFVWLYNNDQLILICEYPYINDTETAPISQYDTISIDSNGSGTIMFEFLGVSIY